jgi:hypothetical protein
LNFKNLSPPIKSWQHEGYAATATPDQATPRREPGLTPSWWPSYDAAQPARSAHAVQRSTPTTHDSTRRRALARSSGTHRSGVPACRPGRKGAHLVEENIASTRIGSTHTNTRCGRPTARRGATVPFGGDARSEEGVRCRLAWSTSFHGPPCSSTQRK